MSCKPYRVVREPYRHPTRSDAALRQPPRREKRVELVLARRRVLLDGPSQPDDVRRVVQTMPITSARRCRPGETPNVSRLARRVKTLGSGKATRTTMSRHPDTEHIRDTMKGSGSADADPAASWLSETRPSSHEPYSGHIRQPPALPGERLEDPA